MSNANNPAFPVSTIDGMTTFGLTKREWFAAMAMQDYISGGFISTYDSDDIARMSVAKANALIARLECAE